MFGKAFPLKTDGVWVGNVSLFFCNNGLLLILAVSLHENLSKESFNSLSVPTFSAFLKDIESPYEVSTELCIPQLP